MAKKIENNKENNSGNMVLVDAKLLGQGLKTAFTGIAMVFDSLGASEASSEIKAAQKAQPAVEMCIRDRWRVEGLYISWHLA